MRDYIPFILVALAIFSAVCIAYVAWELSSEKRDADVESASDSDKSSH